MAVKSTFRVDTTDLKKLFDPNHPESINPQSYKFILDTVRGLESLSRLVVKEIQNDMFSKDAVFTGSLIRAVGRSARPFVDKPTGQFGVNFVIESPYAARWDTADGDGFRPPKREYISEAKIGRWKRFRGFPGKGEKGYRPGLYVGTSMKSKKRWITDPVRRKESEIASMLGLIAQHAIIGTRSRLALSLRR